MREAIIQAILKDALSAMKKFNEHLKDVITTQRVYIENKKNFHVY